MNLRTTFVLAALVLLGAVAWFAVGLLRPVEPASPTQAFLKSLSADDVEAVVLVKGDQRVELQREGKDWVLPGKWPVRPKEVENLLRTIDDLESRFTAIPITDKTKLKQYGLDPAALTVKLKVKGKERTLALGEEASEENTFSRPTYLRLDDEKEIMRLAPGLVAALGKPPEYYQQRRLFPTERVVKEGEKTELLAAESVHVKSKDGEYTLVKSGDDWILESPVKDRVDPDKLKKILTALPDIWAERFLKTDQKLEELGFSVKDKKLDADTVITVKRAGGAALTLLIGKESDVKIRKVAKQAPPQPSPFGPKMDFDIVHEQYRYARLADNEQIFEIKADKLKDVTVAANELRDLQLARFKSGDVIRLEIEHGKELLKLAKKDGKWRLEKPKDEEAETGPVNKLLDKLSDLRVKEGDILDKEDLKSVGLDQPTAIVKLTVEEEKGEGDNKTKKSRDITFRLGVKSAAAKETKKDKAKDKAKDLLKDLLKEDKDDGDKERLYVQVEGWPRINRIEEDFAKDDSLFKLAQRPAYAYKQRRVLDVALADIGTLQIEHDGKSFTLTQEKDKWKLTAPAQADVDENKASGLARDLANLEAAEYVTETPTKDELKKFGLEKPALTATIKFKDEKKSAKTLAVGGERGDKKEFYARLDSGPVFLIKKDLRDDLERPALAYLSTDLGLPRKIRQIAITKGAPPKDEKKYWDYRLSTDGKEWKISGPFDAPAVGAEVDELKDDLANIKAEKFVTAGAKDLKEYGLDQPYLTVRLLPEDAKASEVELHLGKEAPSEPAKDKEKDGKDKEKDKKEKPGRYAKLGNRPGVFVLSDRTVSLLDHSALDFLDKQLARVSAADIEKLKSTGTATFTLEKKKDAWQVVDSPAPPFTADKAAVQELLRPWSNLRAEKIAAYGADIDWDSFGLGKDKAQTLTVIAADEPKEEKTKDDKKDKEKAKPAAKEYRLTLGKDAGDGRRYARLDSQDKVVVLDANASAALAKTHLDFVDRNLLEFDFEGVKTISRQMSGADFELTKQEDAWRFVKPGDRAADDPTVGNLLEKLFRLRAQKIVDYPAKKLDAFGLDKPAAVVTLKAVDFQGREVTYTIKVGNAAPATKDKDGKAKDAGRYVLVDKKDVVALLDPETSRLLVAPPLFYADRNLPSFGSVTKAIQERPGRVAVFQKEDTAWKMTAPTKAEAEDAELEDLVKSMRRLRAEEVVAEKGADLKKYGLEKPEVQWRFLFGDSEKLHLLVGAADAEGRRYAMHSKAPEIFLLSAKVSNQLVEEYRNRKPWPSLDAAQVEKLTFKGPMSFTLTKSGDSWNLSTDADAKVDAAKVTETLDALVRLKAERFVADAKPNLKLYSLDPPVWTIEVQTPTVKRTLLIGNVQEGSKRLYATTPDMDAVFLLSEADAVKIVRPAPAFVQVGPKKE